MTRLNALEGSWACFTNCFHSFCFSNNFCVDPLVFIYGMLGLQVCAYIPDCLFRMGSYYVVFCPGTQRSSCLCRFLFHSQVLSRSLIVVTSFLGTLLLQGLTLDLEDAVTSKAGITGICFWLCFSRVLSFIKGLFFDLVLQQNFQHLWNDPKHSHVILCLCSVLN